MSALLSYNTVLYRCDFVRLQVIARIFYCVNRSWSGRITVAELRRSNLLKTIQLLEQEEDINQVRPGRNGTGRDGTGQDWAKTGRDGTGPGPGQGRDGTGLG